MRSKAPRLDTLMVEIAPRSHRGTASRGTSGSWLEYYSALANQDITETMKNGRYPFQEDAERRIVPDVMRKLAPKPDDILLDIGFGTGTILVPFSFVVREAYGIDNANMVTNLAKTCSRPNITLLSGEFPNVRLPRDDFTLIVAYSVLHVLPSREAVHEFVRAAADRLAPGGRMLLGDIPNTDLKDRFQASAAGREFEAQWRKQMETLSDDEVIRAPHSADPVSFDDRMSMDLMLDLRGAGLDAYLLRQEPDLPFGNTREDIIATKRA